MAKLTASNIPLVIRVACLYLLVIIPLWAVSIFSHPITETKAAQPLPVAPTVKQKREQHTVSGYPMRMSIARLGINLPILDGTYDALHDAWTLSDDALQYATMTTLPNDKRGNTFLYGHNTPAVLENVKDIVPGDVLTIATTSGKTFSYVYKNDLSVTPDKTEVLFVSSSTPQVTLMTCEGIFSLTRRLLYFDFVGVA